ncbi:MAG TPA: hypothetical protein VI386_02635 [Candidatus Sulfotelmatobacter sp.]
MITPHYTDHLVMQTKWHRGQPVIVTRRTALAILTSKQGLLDRIVGWFIGRWFRVRHLSSQGVAGCRHFGFDSNGDIWRH